METKVDGAQDDTGGGEEGKEDGGRWQIECFLIQRLVLLT